MNPFIKYYDRYQEIVESLSGRLENETIVSLIENDLIWKSNHASHPPQDQ
jgi:hypothetical protein